METRFRLAVVHAGFAEPQLNIDVLDEAGVFLGRVDMAWPEYRIALEYDGDHHREQETFRHDQRRRNGFEVNGWLVIHVTAADAARPAVMFERLRQAFVLRAGGTRRNLDASGRFSPIRIAECDVFRPLDDACRRGGAGAGRRCAGRARARARAARRPRQAPAGAGAAGGV